MFASSGSSSTGGRRWPVSSPSRESGTPALEALAQTRTKNYSRQAHPCRNKLSTFADENVKSRPLSSVTRCTEAEPGGGKFEKSGIQFLNLLGSRNLGVWTVRNVKISLSRRKKRKCHIHNGKRIKLSGARMIVTPELSPGGVAGGGPSPAH